jgi:hypothetical protein
MIVKKALKNRKVILSTLWIFYFINIMYADIIGVISHLGSSGEIPDDVATIMTPPWMLASAIFLETGMVMIVLSRVLKHGINRWANIIVAIIQGSGLLASLFIGTHAMSYIFFVVVEMSTLLFIIWYAWTWPKPTVAKSE